MEVSPLLNFGAHFGDGMMLDHIVFKKVCIFQKFRVNLSLKVESVIALTVVFTTLTLLFIQSNTAVQLIGLASSTIEVHIFIIN